MLDDNVVKKIALLRCVVGYLGEKDQFNWWSSSFLNETTKKMFEFTFPRTAPLAQYEAVSAAAAKIHDERIGVGKTFHLFRLPELLETSLVNYVQTNSEAVDSKLTLRSKEDALDTLTSLSGAASVSEEGPVLMGVIDEIYLNLVINKIASVYLTSFFTGKESFPYFRADH